MDVITIIVLAWLFTMLFALIFGLVASLIGVSKDGIKAKIPDSLFPLVFTLFIELWIPIKNIINGVKLLERIIVYYSDKNY